MKTPVDIISIKREYKEDTISKKIGGNLDYHQNILGQNIALR